MTSARRAPPRLLPTVVFASGPHIIFISFTPALSCAIPGGSGVAASCCSGNACPMRLRMPQAWDLYRNDVYLKAAALLSVSICYRYLLRYQYRYRYRGLRGIVLPCGAGQRNA